MWYLKLGFKNVNLNFIGIMFCLQECKFVINFKELCIEYYEKKRLNSIQFRISVNAK